MHPSLRKELLEQYNHINQKILGKGVRLRLAYTYRSPEEQNQLFKQKPKVTNAKAWQSIHQYGMAFDIVLLYDKDGDGKFETASWDMTLDGDKDGIADWMEVVKYLKSQGWEWGGDWRFKDAPHFQKVKGYTWQQLKAKVDKNDIIAGETIKYPKL